MTTEHAARSKKVAVLVAALRESGISASMARESKHFDWLHVALRAGVKPPSAQTIAAVIKTLEQPEESEPIPAQQEADEAADQADAERDDPPRSLSEELREAEAYQAPPRN